jgi:hypothetical protein
MSSPEYPEPRNSGHGGRGIRPTAQSNAIADDTKRILESTSLNNLKEVAKRLRMRNYSKLKKPALIAKILQEYKGREGDIFPRASSWKRHQNHIYGIASIIGVPLGIIGIVLTIFIFLRETEESRLQKEYPYGYVLYDAQGPHEGPKTFRLDEAVMRADWQWATLKVDRTAKTAFVTIPNPNWKGKSPLPRELDAKVPYVWPGVKYILGKPIELPTTLTHVDGQPKICLEILDDAGSSPRWVLGLK